MRVGRSSSTLQRTPILTTVLLLQRQFVHVRRLCRALRFASQRCSRRRSLTGTVATVAHCKPLYVHLHHAYAYRPNDLHVHGCLSHNDVD